MRGNRISNTYDALGNVVTMQDPLGRSTTYAYDAVSNLIIRSDARGVIISQSYDALDRLTKVLYPDGGCVTYAFNAAGQTTSMNDSTGLTSYAYDAVGQLQNVSYPLEQILTYAYDAVGNRISLTDPAGGLTSYTHDAQNRLTSLVNPFNETTSFSYDALSHEVQKTLFNGLTYSHTYDASGREILLEQRDAIGNAMAVYTATYDSVGNRITTAELDGAFTTYTYDADYQLLSETRSGSHADARSYTYDPTGNRLVQNANGTFTTSTYDAANQLSSAITNASIVSFTYDGAGNQIVENASGILTTYTWDAENQLSEATSPTGNETYSYSGDGQRRQKSSDDETTIFVWDGENILLELDNSLITQVQYTLVPGSYGPLLSMWRVGEAETFLPFFDLQGSARQLLKQNNLVSDTYLFSSFGEELWGTGDTPNPFRYVGIAGYYRDAVNQIQVRARVFKPQQGTWMSPDPIGFDGGDWNLYRYVENDPVNNYDPNGLWPQGLHYSLTKQLAQRSYISYKYQGKNCTMTFKYPELIGQGAAEMDNILNSAGDPLMLPYHFNWHSRSFDIRFPNTSQYDTRFVFMIDQLHISTAIAKGHNSDNGYSFNPTYFDSVKGQAPSELCKEASRQEGLGIHALQDMDAHMDLSPAEHMDRRQRGFVDNPNWFRVKVKPVISKYQHDASFMDKNYPKIAGIAENQFNKNKPVRIFKWTAIREFDPKGNRLWWKNNKGQVIFTKRGLAQGREYNPRYQNTKRQASRWLCEFLKNIKNTPCGVRKCGCPPPKNGIKCG